MLTSASFVDGDRALQLQTQLLAAGQAQEMAETFRILGDPTRMKLVWILSKGELCVGDLSVLLEMNQSAVSSHLRILRNHHLVKFHKIGKMVYYALNDDHIVHLLAECLEHVRDRENTRG